MPRPSFEGMEFRGQDVQFSGWVAPYQNRSDKLVDVPKAKGAASKVDDNTGLERGATARDVPCSRIIGSPVISVRIASYIIHLHEFGTIAINALDNTWHRYMIL